MTGWPQVSTASTVDALEELGLDGLLLAGARGHGAFVGPAATVDVTDVDDPVGAPHPEGVSEYWELVDSLSAGSVLLMTTGGRALTTVGGVTIATCLARGVQGVVTDGGVRDLAEILGYGVPIRYRFVDPRAMRGRTRIRGCGGPVKMNGLTVWPDDVLVGDDDGVVRVPRERAAEVLSRAQEIDRVEALWAEAARSTGSISASYREVSRHHGSPH